MESSILLIMSLSGTVVFVLYGLFYIVARKFFPIRWRYCILKLSLIFFLLPLPYFKYRAEGILTTIFSSFIEVPSVIGIFKPTIYIPKQYFTELSLEDLRIILMHEIIHIRHMDLLFKFISLFSIAINWFNPLCYLLYREIGNMSEIYCDNEIVRNKDINFVNIESDFMK